jgi:hypothetical protein
MFGTYPAVQSFKMLSFAIESDDLWALKECVCNKRKHATDAWRG